MSVKRMLLVFGGRSSEHEVSLRSAAQVLAALDRSRLEPILLGIDRQGTFRTGPVDAALEQVIRDGAVVTDLAGLRPDVVFPLLHGPFGEDGTFQGLLEILDLPYVGSNTFAAALCMDKSAVKFYLQAATRVPVVPWAEVTTHTRARLDLDATIESLGLPLFVKPSNQGSSVGVGRADDRESLGRAIDTALEFDTKVVIEQAIDAREIELAVFGDGGPETIVSQPGEITLPSGAWYDYETKYLNDSAGLRIPAELSEATTSRLRDLALEAFRATGCSGLCRIDFFVDRSSGEVYLNELNTMPGFTTISMYPKLMEHAGLPYADLIVALCEQGIVTHQRRKRLRITPDDSTQP